MGEPMVMLSAHSDKEKDTKVSLNLYVKHYRLTIK
jgi:hypothetical protein